MKTFFVVLVLAAFSGSLYSTHLGDGVPDENNGDDNNNQPSGDGNQQGGGSDSGGSTSIVNSGDWSSTATFIQNLFGTDQSYKQTKMMTLLPTSMQSYCNKDISSSLNSITMFTLEAEITAMIGVCKEWINQLKTPNYKCPCIESMDDFYSRCKKAAPYMYQFWGKMVTLIISKWSLFISKLSVSAKTCVNNTMSTVHSKWNNCWSTTQKSYTSLSQKCKDDVMTACTTISPSIRDVFSLQKVQSHFGLSGNFNSQLGISGSYSG